MIRFLILTAALLLPACTTTQAAFDCANAQNRREIYQAGIDAANLVIASGRGVQAGLAARTAAETALAVLNARCPMDGDRG